VNRAAVLWRIARLAVVAAFLAACARYYHPDSGFTSLIRFSTASHDTQLTAVRDLPKDEQPGGYDGAFYAQMAIDPLLKNPEIDRALDEPPYRGRRILFSWTAYALGFGDPWRILQIYAVQNIACWLLLAWLLWYVIPQTGAKSFALWTGTLLAHGLLVSVWLAVTDGPSALLIAVSTLYAERGRQWLAAIVLGVAGLARETNVLAVTMLTKWVARDARSWLRVGASLLIAAAPLVLWMDYLRSIYRQRALAGGDHFTPGLDGVIWKLHLVSAELRAAPFDVRTLFDVTALIGFFAQGAFVVWMLARHRRSPWAIVAVTYFALALIVKPAVWEGWPGAFTRVALPLTIGANVLMSREQTPWWLIAVANLGVFPGVRLFFF
jgi:hypothetical protein